MWDLVIFGAGTVGVSSFATVVVAVLTGWRPKLERKTVAQIAWDRVNNHQERKKDQYGFWAELEWVIVAGLEHDLGFSHTSESEPHCNRKECWKETQHPTYEWNNGFLTITNFPTLPEEVSEFDAFGRRLTNSFGRSKNLFEPVSAAAPIGELNERVNHLEEKWGLKHELAKRKAMNGAYIPGSITANEARELGYSETRIKEEQLKAKKEMDEKQHQWYVEAAAKRKKELELKFKHDDKWHSDEYRELEAMLKEKLSKGSMMVLPAGYTVTWKRGGELAYIESPTGLSVWVDPELYRVKPTLTATDRRRDAEPDYTPEVTHTKPGEQKPEDILFSEALKAMQMYSTPGRYED